MKNFKYHSNWCLKNKKSTLENKTRGKNVWHPWGRARSCCSSFQAWFWSPRGRHFLRQGTHRTGRQRRAFRTGHQLTYLPCSSRQPFDFPHELRIYNLCDFAVQWWIMSSLSEKHSSFWGENVGPWGARPRPRGWAAVRPRSKLGLWNCFALAPHP